MEYLIVQIDEKRVKAARFDVSGRRLSLAGTFTFEFDDQQGLPEVATKIAESVVGSMRVILCLPTSLFAQRDVELPLKDLRKVREIMPTHLQAELALPLEEVIFDVLPSGDGRFMAFWVKRSDVERAIKVFKDAGLEPAIVTSAAFAWPFIPEIPANCAVSDGTALALLEGGRLSYLKDFGDSDQSAKLINALSVLDYSEKSLPDQLFIFGQNFDQLPETNDHKIEIMRLEQPEDLTTIFSNSDSFNQLVGIYAVARASQSSALPDFRRGDLAWTAGDAKLRKKLLLTAILTGIIVLLLFGFKILQYRQTSSDLTSLNNSILKIYRDVFPGRTKAVDELAEIKGEIRKLGGVSNSSGILDILKKVADAKGSTINGLYELELEGRTVIAKGDARSAQAVNDFKAALMLMMTTVDLGEVKSRPDGTVTFSLTATLMEENK